jgi:hypothetical protein
MISGNLHFFELVAGYCLFFSMLGFWVFTKHINNPILFDSVSYITNNANLKYSETLPATMILYYFISCLNHSTKCQFLKKWTCPFLGIFSAVSSFIQIEKARKHVKAT